MNSDIQKNIAYNFGWIHSIEIDHIAENSVVITSITHATLRVVKNIFIQTTM